MLVKILVINFFFSLFLFLSRSLSFSFSLRLFLSSSFPLFLSHTIIAIIVVFVLLFLLFLLFLVSLLTKEHITQTNNKKVSTYICPIDLI